MSNLGLYIHIPFCIKKCYYCDFVSFTNSQNHQTYFDALLKEIRLNHSMLSNYQIDSIFIGGGTPSAVDPSFISCILNALSNYQITKDCEITIETNPGTLDLEKLKAYQASGINRISIGLQSANDKELTAIGRIHDFNTFLKSYDLIKKSGFSNTNIDLMFGLPNQTIESFQYTLEKVKELNPTHLSAYSLIIEENTPIATMDLSLPDEDSEREMYRMLLTDLPEYHRYEISNFAKLGYECKHNLKYWKMEEFLGLGLNAHSFSQGKRFYNYSNMENYLDAIKSNLLPIEFSEKESQEELLKDTIITGLRLVEGIDIKKINQLFQIDFLEKYKSKIEKYVAYHLLQLTDYHLKFTDRGFEVSNTVLQDFI